MSQLEFKDISLHYRDEGDPSGAPLVLSPALGTDLSIWDSLLGHLPQGLRIIRYDLRGHGGSSAPPPPYTMGALVGDAERVLDHLEVRDAVFVGISIGGLIGQGLALKRLNVVRALVLSNTAAKMGTRDLWQRRIDTVQAKGMAAIADDTVTRWFSRNFMKTGDVEWWRHMLLSQSVEGYVGCCHAIAGTDFYTPTSSLRLPVLGLAGSEDGTTPSDLVRETINLVPGAQFSLMSRTGHLPCIERPDLFAEKISDFLKEIGHV